MKQARALLAPEYHELLARRIDVRTLAGRAVCISPIKRRLVAVPPFHHFPNEQVLTTQMPRMYVPYPHKG